MYRINIAVNYKTSMTTLTFVQECVYSSYEEIEEDTTPRLLGTNSTWDANYQGILPKIYLELNRTSYEIKEVQGQTIRVCNHYSCDFPTATLYQQVLDVYPYKSYGENCKESYCITDTQGITILYGWIHYNDSEPYQVQLQSKDFELLKRFDLEYERDKAITGALVAYQYEDFPELQYGTTTQSGCNIYHGGIYAPAPIGVDIITQLGEDILTEDDNEILT